MIFLNAFLLAGSVCLIGQIILDNTTLTPGHVTSILTVVGAVLAFLGWYEPLCKWGGAGASVLITNFGNMLFLSGVEGFRNHGFLGIFTGLLTKASGAIVSAIVFSFVLAMLFRPKD